MVDRRDVGVVFKIFLGELEDAQRCERFRLPEHDTPVQRARHEQLVCGARAHVIGWWVNDAADPHPQMTMVNATYRRC